MLGEFHPTPAGDSLPAGGADGQVLTSNGAGGAAWEDAAGGGGEAAIVWPDAEPDALFHVGRTEPLFDGKWVRPEGAWRVRLAGREVYAFRRADTDYLNVGAYTDTDGWTWAAVCYTHDITVGTQAIIGAQDGGDADESRIIIRVTNTGVVQVQIGDSTNYTLTSTDNPAVSSGTWHAIVVVHRAGVAATELYVDGVAVAVSTSPAAANNGGVTGKTLRFGTQGASGVNYWDGYGKIFARWSDALSVAAATATSATLAAVMP